MQEIVENQPLVNKKRLSLSLYINYLIHGFGLIILAQNMVALGGAWSVPIRTVSFVISGIGIGRLIAYLITGALADAISRKFFVFVGMISYLIFAVGMITTHSIPVAYFLAILAGVANSALDAGTYTTLVEINDGNGYDTILLKGFMSIGEFLLPLIVASLNANNLWFGWSFVIMAALIVLNMINLSHDRFPKMPSVKTQQSAVAKESRHFSGKRIVATFFLLLYGYTSMALMIWFTQWITLFAQKSLNFGNLTAHSLMSLYSTGSITGVIILFFLLKREVSEMKILISFNCIATLSLLVLVSLGSNAVMAEIASFVFGFTAASGIMQTGLTVFMRLFPNHHGMVTGAFYFFGSIASLTVPLITGALSDQSIQLAFSGDVIIGLDSTAIVIILAVLQQSRKEEKVNE